MPPRASAVRGGPATACGPRLLGSALWHVLRPQEAGRGPRRRRWPTARAVLAWPLSCLSSLCTFIPIGAARSPPPLPPPHPAGAARGCCSPPRHHAEARLFRAGAAALQRPGQPRAVWAARGRWVVARRGAGRGWEGQGGRGQGPSPMQELAPLGLAARPLLILGRMRAPCCALLAVGRWAGLGAGLAAAHLHRMHRHPPSAPRPSPAAAGAALRYVLHVRRAATPLRGAGWTASSRALARPRTFKRARPPALPTARAGGLGGRRSLQQTTSALALAIASVRGAGAAGGGAAACRPRHASPCPVPLLASPACAQAARQSAPACHTIRPGCGTNARRRTALALAPRRPWPAATRTRRP